MLKSLFSFGRPRSGAASPREVRRPPAAGRGPARARPGRTAGSAFLTSPVVVARRARPSDSLTGFSLPGEGPQVVQRRAEHLGELVGLARARPGSRRSVGPSSPVARRTSRSCAGDRAERGVRRVDQARRSRSSCLPTRPNSRFMLWIRLARFSLRLATSRLSLARSRLSGPRLPSSSPRSLPRPLQALSAADQQHPQIGAGVGVEQLEDLVEVDVGRRVGDRDRVPLLVLAGRLGAGVELEEHVLAGRSSAAAGWSRPCRRAGTSGRCPSSPRRRRRRARPWRCPRRGHRRRARSGPARA